MSDYIRKIRVSEIDESTGEKTETVKDIYAAKAVEADSAGSADTAGRASTAGSADTAGHADVADVLKIYHLNDMKGQTIAYLKSKLDEWLATANKYTGAMCCFMGSTNWINLWNTNDDTAVIESGCMWTCTIVGSHNSTDYVQLMVSAYGDKFIYYVSKYTGTWGKMFKPVFVDDTVEKAMNATNDSDGNPINQTYLKKRDEINATTVNGVKIYIDNDNTGRYKIDSADDLDDYTIPVKKKTYTINKNITGDLGGFPFNRICTGIIGPTNDEVYEIEYVCCPAENKNESDLDSMCSKFVKIRPGSDGVNKPFEIYLESGMGHVYYADTSKNVYTFYTYALKFKIVYNLSTDEYAFEVAKCGKGVAYNKYPDDLGIIFDESNSDNSFTTNFYLQIRRIHVYTE